jgi:hypothetical protein
MSGVRYTTDNSASQVGIRQPFSSVPRTKPRLDFESLVALVLGTLVIPSFAQESEIDAQDAASGMSLELQEIVYGRDGFSANAAESSATSAGMPLGVWRAINSRDGFDFFASATQRPEAVVNGMSAELWGVIASRNGFDVYAADALADGSSELGAAKPAAVSAALWQIISGRGGFGSASSCEVC